MTGEENYIEHALIVGKELTGLSLEQLGFEPRLEDLDEHQRNRLDADDLERMSSITPARRDQSLFQAQLLAGALWEASAVLIDQLFEDLDSLVKLDRIDRQDIAATFVLSGLPPRQADKYDVRFTRQFIVIAADMTGMLIRGWTRPSCVAQELALRCLFDQVEIIQDLYDLDLPRDWRGMLEQHMLEDTDSEMLYQNAMDGFEDDVDLNKQLGFAPMKLEHWFEPFNNASVPPFVR
ncbi:hypothetical protein [Pseudarthrobacter sp. 1C304]|uniref:hypothetical protein n=1 Tax=Pseudarthrobacter sp. 1C304 TaxID=3457438 RepID=UPI003FD44D62